MLVTLTFDENDPRAIALIAFLRALDFVNFMDDAVYEADTSTASQVSEPVEQYRTIDTEEQTAAMREHMVRQALKAEDEIREGKGLTAAEARAFMDTAMKEMHRNGDDRLLMDNVFGDEDFEVKSVMREVSVD